MTSILICCIIRVRFIRIYMVRFNVVSLLITKLSTMSKAAEKISQIKFFKCIAIVKQTNKLREFKFLYARRDISHSEYV